MIYRSILMTDRQTDRQDKTVFFCCTKKENAIQKGAPCPWFFRGHDALFFVALKTIIRERKEIV